MGREDNRKGVQEWRQHEQQQHAAARREADRFAKNEARDRKSEVPAAAPGERECQRMQDRLRIF